MMILLLRILSMIYTKQFRSERKKDEIQCVPKYNNNNNNNNKNSENIQ